MSPAKLPPSLKPLASPAPTDPRINQLKQQLTAIDRQITKLKSQPTIDELEQKKAQVEAKLSALQNASAANAGKTPTNSSSNDTGSTPFGPAYKTTLRKIGQTSLNTSQGLYDGKKNIDISSLLS